VHTPPLPADSGVQVWEGSRGAAVAALRRAGSAVLLSHWQWHVTVPCCARWSRRRRLSPEMPARGTGVVDSLTGDGESLTWEGSRSDASARRAWRVNCELNLLFLFREELDRCLPQLHNWQHV